MAMPKSSRKKRDVEERLDSDPTEHKREKKRMRSAEKEASKSKLESSTPNDPPDEKKDEDPPELSVHDWRKSQSITVKAPSSVASVPDPFRAFDQAPFGASIQRALTAAGFAAPTAIQAQAWSIATEKYDMISIAKTGSGMCIVLCCCYLHCRMCGAL